MNKWLSRIGAGGFKCQSSGDKVDNIGDKSALSTMSLSISCTKEKKLYIHVCKEEELNKFIKKISDHYGGDDPQFLSNYINDVINEYSYNLDSALSCFHNIYQYIRNGGNIHE